MNRHYDGMTGDEVVEQFENWLTGADTDVREEAARRAGNATKFTPFGDGLDDPNPTRARTFILSDTG